MKRILNKKEMAIFIIILLVMLLCSFQQFFREYHSWYLMEELHTILAKVNRYSFYNYQYNTGIYGLFLYLSPLVLAYVSTSGFQKIYYSGFIDNIVQRKNRKKVLWAEIRKSWMSALILPLIGIIIFLIGSMIYKETDILLNSQADGIPVLMLFSASQSGNQFLFVLFHLLFLFLFGIIIINVALIMMKHIKNQYLSAVVTFLVLIFSEISIMLVGVQIPKMLNANSTIINAFSIYNMIFLNGINSVIAPLIFGITLVAITAILVYFSYFPKQKWDVTK